MHVARGQQHLFCSLQKGATDRCFQELDAANLYDYSGNLLLSEMGWERDTRTVAEYLSFLAREWRDVLLYLQVTVPSVPGSRDKGENPRDLYSEYKLGNE